jgi:hypothetical protein
MAAGGNWDLNQNLNNGRVEWPTGPIVLTGGETATWVEAWVVQRSTGASQRTVQSNFNPANPKWNADGHPWKQGTFLPGPAMGIALLAASAPGNPPTSTFYWWVDMVDLA